MENIAIVDMMPLVWKLFGQSAVLNAGFNRLNDEWIVELVRQDKPTEQIRMSNYELRIDQDLASSILDAWLHSLVQVQVKRVCKPAMIRIKSLGSPRKRAIMSRV